MKRKAQTYKIRNDRVILTIDSKVNKNEMIYNYGVTFLKS